METKLSSEERLTDFGPNPFLVDQDRLTRFAEGKRTKDLKAAVSSCCESSPGVYGFLDASGVLFYVGKSKQLRSRLLSYFSPKLRRRKPGHLIRQARGILWESTPSEFAALLRELQLIQRYRPRFNVKDQPHRGRSTYLCLGRPMAPGLLVTSDPAEHIEAAFGPFWAGPKLDEAADALNRFFRLRDCPNSQQMLFSHDANLLADDVRPGCLRFELETCLGPCVAACSKTSYLRKVREAKAFLDGDCEMALEQLKQRMDTAAQDQEFELAARHRDDLASLTFLKNRLRRIRSIQDRYNFVYPKDSLWYLIRNGRIAAVSPPPTTKEARKTARELLKKTYSPDLPADDLTTRRPDTLLLIASWFRRNAGELDQTLSPNEALEKCKIRRTAA